MSETIATALIMASATIVAALITSRAYKKSKRNATRDIHRSEHCVERVQALLIRMNQLNIKATLSIAQGVIGDFAFSDISATNLEPRVQALICKRDGSATGRWSKNEDAKNRLKQARLVETAIELQKLVGKIAL